MLEVKVLEKSKLDGLGECIIYIRMIDLFDLKENYLTRNKDLLIYLLAYF